MCRCPIVAPASTPGDGVDSLWIGGQGHSGIVFFVSALDAEFYRLHSLTIGQQWVRHPLEQIGFQHSVEALGKAHVNLVFAFNANTRHELSVGPDGSLSLPAYPETFGPLRYPGEPVTFRFDAKLFETMNDRWSLMGQPDHAATIAKMNALATTQDGGVQLMQIAEAALKAATFAPIGEASHERIDYATFSPDTYSWSFGPSHARDQTH